MWKVLKRTWKGTPLGSSELYRLTYGATAVDMELVTCKSVSWGAGDTLSPKGQATAKFRGTDCGHGSDSQGLTLGGLRLQSPPGQAPALGKDQRSGA